MSEVREWLHARRGRIRGVVVWEDETWVKIRLVGDHDLHYARPPRPFTRHAEGEGDVLTARKRLLEEVHGG